MKHNVKYSGHDPLDPNERLPESDAIAFKRFYESIKNQQDIPADIQKIVNDHFMELFEPVADTETQEQLFKEKFYSMFRPIQPENKHWVDSIWNLVQSEIQTRR